MGGGGSCRITDTSKKPQPERQNNVCGSLPIKSRFCPKALPVKRFFALPMGVFNGKWGGAGLVGEEWNCAGVRVGEILRQVEY